MTFWNLTWFRSSLQGSARNLAAESFNFSNYNFKKINTNSPCLHIFLCCTEDCYISLSLIWLLIRVLYTLVGIPEKHPVWLLFFLTLFALVNVNLIARTRKCAISWQYYQRDIYSLVLILPCLEIKLSATKTERTPAWLKRHQKWHLASYLERVVHVSVILRNFIKRLLTKEDYLVSRLFLHGKFAVTDW